MNINGTYPMNDIELFENITVLPAEAVERIRKTAKSQLRAVRAWKEKNREKTKEINKSYYEENREERMEYQKEYYTNVVKKRRQEQSRILKLAKEAGIV